MSPAIHTAALVQVQHTGHLGQLLNPGASVPVYAPMSQAMPAAATPVHAVAPAACLVSLEDIIRTAIRHWKTAALVATLVALPVLFFLLCRTKQYQAEASLIVRLRDAKVFNFERIVDNSGEAAGALFMLNNHKIQLKSRNFLEYLHRTAPAADVDALLAPPAHPGMVDRLLGFLPGKAAHGSPEQVRHAAFLTAMEGVKVDYVKESHILSASLRHHDPAVAARIANFFVTGYLGYLAEEEKSSARDVATALTKQVGETARQVREAELKLAACRTASGLLDEDENKGASSDKLRQLTGDITREEATQAGNRQLLAQIQAAGSDFDRLLALEALVQHPVVATQRNVFAAKSASFAQVSTVFGPKHPTFITTKAELATARTDLQAALERAINEIRNSGAAGVARLEQLRGTLKQTQETVLASTGAGSVDKNMLASSLAAQRNHYNELTSRLSQVQATAELDTVTNVAISDSATPPEKAVAPSKPLALLASGFVFATLFLTVPLFLGAAGHVRQHGWAKVIASTTASSAALALPAPQLAAALPPAHAPLMLAAPATPPAQAPSISEYASPMTVLAGLPALDWPDGYRAPEALARAFQTTSPLRMATDGLLRHLDAFRPAHKRVIVPTSVESGAGKSLLAASMGVAFALQGRSVLIIDCDFRSSPSYNWLPGHKNNPLSLAGYLETSGANGFDLASLSYPNSSLYYLPAGQLQTSPAAQLASPAFGHLVQCALQHVDVVILDAPTVCHDELASLARLSTDVLLVQAAGLHSMTEARVIHDWFAAQGLGRTLAGSVLNQRTGRA